VEIRVEIIKKRLENLKVLKSAGPDGMHPRVLKEFKNEIAYPLKAIFESSLENNTLPNDWKSGNITSIYKKGKNVMLKIMCFNYVKYDIIKPVSIHINVYASSNYLQTIVIKDHSQA
jgi:hypothetical protein